MALSEREQQRWDELEALLVKVKDEADPMINLVASVTCDGNVVMEHPATRAHTIRAYVKAVSKGVTRESLIAGGDAHVNLVTLIVREKETGKIRMHIDSNRMECGCEH